MCSGMFHHNFKCRDFSTTFDYKYLNNYSFLLLLFFISTTFKISNWKISNYWKMWICPMSPCTIIITYDITTLTHHSTVQKILWIKQNYKCKGLFTDACPSLKTLFLLRYCKKLRYHQHRLYAGYTILADRPAALRYMCVA